MSSEVSGADVDILWAGKSAENANFVTQQMVELGASLQQLIALLQELSGQAGTLRERLDTLRQGAPEDLSPAARGAWERQRAAATESLQGDIDSLNRRLTSLSQDAQRAQDELKKLELDALPQAQARDLLESSQRVEKERVRLESEMRALAQDVEKSAGAQHDSETLAKRAKLNQNSLHTPLPRADLASDIAVDDPAAGDASLSSFQSSPDEATQEQLTDIVGLISGMLRANKGGKSHVKAGIWSSTPISSMTATLQSRWSGLVSQMGTDGWMDVNQLIQWVLREAYTTSTEDLKFYAYKVKFFTELKKRIREELTRARTFQSVHQSTRDHTVLDKPFEKRQFSLQPDMKADGSLQPREPEAGEMATTASDLQEYIRDLEEKLNSAGDDAQLAQVDLQAVTQRQQQSLQLLSNLSKVLHETSMAIIRKIGS